ncbi:MAG: hypothetical protein JSV13_09105 [Nitrospiraceae bacterium]|nr:MAG: hypothetical protein JSV13_09105 [Nitrospiraceae bacterium]
MRKFLTIILSALFVLSFAASSFAVHAEIPAETQAVIAKGSTQITLGGHLRFRGWYRKDHGNAEALPFDSTSSSWYDSRFRLSFHLQVTPNVEGFATYNVGNVKWGSFNSSGGQEASLFEHWVRITGSGLLGVPAGLKVGHMPLALGHKLFFDHTDDGDDALLLTIDPTKNMHITLINIKFAGDGGRAAGFAGGNDPFDQTDDMDGYVAVLNYDHENGTAGVNYTYLNEPDFNLHFSNLGAHAHGTIAGFGYKVAGNLQFGDIGTTAGGKDMDAKGWAVEAKLSYNLNPVTLRASFGYGTGDDDPNDSDFEEFFTTLSSTVYYTFVYDYQIRTASCCTQSHGANGGLANTTYYGLGVDYNPSKNLKTYANAFLLNASDTPSGVSDDLGWEIDAGFVYTVARNLKYYFDIGYFDADDWYQDTDPAGREPEEVIAIRQQLILSF